jgi:hypothetical protein
VNTHRDGTPLTMAEMEQIALDNDLITAEKLATSKALMHNGQFPGFLTSLTAEVRFDMMCRKELIVRTSVKGPKAARPCAVDQEALSMLTREKGSNE